ncbi:MAG: divalent metal cation transporter [Actinobacteria bacterium]|nr:MAG: divalent metal cation transporter [Actinomycetota bacterium]
MFVILPATAVTLGRNGGSIESADQAASALRPLAGQFASLLFTFGIVGTGLLAITTLAGSSAYASAEVFHWREGLSRTLGQAPGFYGVVVASWRPVLRSTCSASTPSARCTYRPSSTASPRPRILVLMVLASRSRELGRWRSGAVSVTLVRRGCHHHGSTAHLVSVRLAGHCELPSPHQRTRRRQPLNGPRSPAFRRVQRTIERIEFVGDLDHTHTI